MNARRLRVLIVVVALAIGGCAPPGSDAGAGATASPPGASPSASFGESPGESPSETTEQGNPDDFGY